MKSSKGMLAISILIIAVGIGLLLNAMGLLPKIDWLWTLGLLVVGVLILGFGGIDKVTIVIGPFLIFAALCSFLRQINLLPLKYEIPLLIIVLGCLLFLSIVLELPFPGYLQEVLEAKEEEQEET